MHRLYGIVIIPLVCLTASAASLQSPSAVNQEATLSFEVAAVKLHADDGVAPGFFSAAWCHGIDSKFQAGTSIAPPALGRCSFLRTNLNSLIYSAYFRNSHILSTDVILKAPDWAQRDLYDIEAKADDPSKTTETQLLQMVRTLLKERFKLQFHYESRQIAGYRLLAPKGDVKLKRSQDEGTPSIRFGGGQAVVQNASMSYFASTIIGMVHGPVSDATGLTGVYDFVIKRSNEQSAWDPDAFIDDVQDQLGLRFEREKTTIDAMVIDHVEKPLLQ